MPMALLTVLVLLTSLGLEAFRLREGASEKCNHQALASCKQLASKGKLDAETVAKQLAISTTTARSVFRKIGVEGRVRCEVLCNKLVAKAPEILKVKLPDSPDQACLNKECTKHVSVSDRALLAHRLKNTIKGKKRKHHAPPIFLKNVSGSSTTSGEKNLRQKPGRASKKMDDVEGGARQLLNVHFSLFPAQAPDDLMALPALGPKISSRQELVDRVMEACQKATAWLASAIRKLEAVDDKRVTGQLRNFIRKWFGKHRDPKAAKETIREILDGAHHVMSNVVIRKGGGRLDRYQNKKACTPDVYAYVYPYQTTRVDGEDRYVINLCDLTLGTEDWVIFGGTLVHEATHHVSTYDWQYGEDDCQELAKVHPLFAISNADNYEYFIDDLVANYKRGSPKTWLPPLKDNEGNRWEPGEKVLVRGSGGPDAEWTEATVLNVTHGHLVVQDDGADYWRHVTEARREPSPLCNARSLGDWVYVKDMEKDAWKPATIQWVDGEGDVVADLFIEEKVRSRRHKRELWQGWKYCHPHDVEEPEYGEDWIDDAEWSEV